MLNFKTQAVATICGAWLAALCSGAFATQFNVPGGDLRVALDSYARQAGISLLYPVDAVEGVASKGAKGDLSADDALAHILAGTGFRMSRHGNSAVTIIRDGKSASAARDLSSVELAAAPVSVAPSAALETVTVTSSKIGGDVQNI